MSVSLREKALRMLARRDHARVELAHKLSPHADSAQQLDALLDDLAARSLLSDERYAAARVHSRSARVGDARLAYELRSKGVSGELVKLALAGAEDELVRARQVWLRRFGNQPCVAGDAVERSRQIRFLVGRGFSGETVRRVLRGDLEDD